jgi:hypothetical protein
MTRDTADKDLLCPSAQPEMEGARVIGVFTRNPAGEGQRVAYLAEAQPLTPELLAVSGEARPTEVLRVAAKCMGGGCGHFDGHACSLAQRVVEMLDPAVAGLPRCAIRPTCRWFREAGRAACLRCPQVLTDRREGSDLDRAVAGPSAALPA